MSGPDTRPLGDNFPDVKLEAKERGSVSSKIEVDNSVNKHLPYIWFNGILGAGAFCLAIGSLIISILFWHRAEVAENHWRNDEVDLIALKREVARLNEVSHDRNR
jgi:hypothetical protein